MKKYKIIKVTNDYYGDYEDFTTNIEAETIKEAAIKLVDDLVDDHESLDPDYVITLEENNKIKTVKLIVTTSINYELQHLIRYKGGSDVPSR